MTGFPCFLDEIFEYYFSIDTFLLDLSAVTDTLLNMNQMRQ